jgi:hypothetical protein
VRAALASGELAGAEGTDPVAHRVSDHDTDGPYLLAVANGRCVFFDAGEPHACAVQRALGHDALPLACRQFPRVSVVDPRGVSVTLSHYCPTAASLLDRDSGATRIDELAPAFPAHGEYVGLDATTSLPPLLRPDMLMDWASWWEWERLAVETIDSERDRPAVALARLATAIEAARAWRPDEGALRDRVRSAFQAARTDDPAPLDFTPDDLEARLLEVVAAIPVELRTRDMVRSPHMTLASRVPGRATSRLIAAHAFANWTAHLGRGLRTWLRSVEAPYALRCAGLDVRTADLWLRHLADPRELTAAWGHVETRRGHVEDT